MGYFLTKIAAKAKEDERTLAGTAAGAGKGVAGVAGLAGALGGGAYGVSKGIEAHAKRKGSKIEAATREAQRKHYASGASGKEGWEKSRAIQEEGAKQQREARKALNWVEGKKQKFVPLVKKHGKWAIPAALGAGALGGGLLLND